jgi:hypothetical protein
VNETDRVGAGGAGTQAVEDGTPVAGAVPFVVIEWSAVRDVLVTKRLLLGWSQAHLAGQVVVGSGGRPMHQNTVYKFEKRGYRGPEDLPVVLRLCEALGLELRVGLREVPGGAGAPCAANPKRLGPAVGPARVRVPLSVRAAQSELLGSAQPRVAVPEVDESFGF